MQVYTTVFPLKKKSRAYPPAVLINTYIQVYATVPFKKGNKELILQLSKGNIYVQVYGTVFPIKKERRAFPPAVLR